MATPKQILQRARARKKMDEPALPEGEASAPDQIAAELFSDAAGVPVPTRSTQERMMQMLKRRSPSVPRRGERAPARAVGEAGSAGTAGTQGEAAEYKPTINLNPQTPAFGPDRKPVTVQKSARNPASFREFGVGSGRSIPTSQARPGSVRRSPSDFAAQQQPAAAPQTAVSQFPGLDQMVRDRTPQQQKPVAAVEKPAETGTRSPSRTPMSALGVELIRSLVNPRIRSQAAPQANMPAASVDTRSFTAAAKNSAAAAGKPAVIPYFADAAAAKPGSVMRNAADFAPRKQQDQPPANAPDPDAALRKAEQKIANAPLFREGTPTARPAQAPTTRGLLTREIGSLFTGDVADIIQKIDEKAAAKAAPPAPIPANRAKREGPETNLPAKGTASSPAPAAAAAAEAPKWYNADTGKLESGAIPQGLKEVGIYRKKGEQQSFPSYGNAPDVAPQRERLRARAAELALIRSTPGGADMLRRIRRRDAAATAAETAADPKVVGSRMFGESRKRVEQAIARDVADGFIGEAKQKTEAWNRGAAGRNKLLMAEVKKRQAEARSARSRSPLAPL